MPDEDIGQDQDSWNVEEYNKLVSSWNNESSETEETTDNQILETNKELSDIEEKQGLEGFQGTDPQEQYFDENLDDERYSENEVSELEHSMLLEKAINAGVAGIADFAPVAALWKW